MNGITKGYTELNDLALFYISGPDAKRFLNGQITQEIGLAKDQQTIFTCICNAKGKLQVVGHLRAYKDGFLMDVPSALRESAFMRLDMYLIADDAEILDVTDELKMYHIIGENTDTSADVSWHSNRFGIEGIDTLKLPEEGSGNILSNQLIEDLRIKNALPIWGRELDESMLPPEAKLEARAISYTKGCYTGQEIISRMKSSGKVNRVLSSFNLYVKCEASLQNTIDLPLAIPNPENADAKSAGVITSCTSISKKSEDTEGWRFLCSGLGFLNKKYRETNSFEFDKYKIEQTFATSES